jgi:hypothetical protein
MRLTAKPHKEMRTKRLKQSHRIRPALKIRRYWMRREALMRAVSVR